MGCYYTLWHDTYAFYLLFYKVYMKRGNAGSWNSGLEKEQILETYFAHLQKSRNSTRIIFRIKKIISKLSGRDSAATRRNLGGTNLGLRRSCSAGETSLREGEIIAIIITNARLIGRGKSPSTSSPAPSPLKP